MIALFNNTCARPLGLTGERKNEGIYSTCLFLTGPEIAAFDTAESCTVFAFLVHSTKYVILISQEQYNQIVHHRSTYFISMATAREHQESPLVPIFFE